MTITTFLTISAFISMLPATILPFSRPPARDAIFWLVLFVAISGPAVWVAASFGSAWRIGLGQSLWLTVAITLILFGTLSLAMRDLWRLAPLLFPYMLIIALLATLWLHPTGRPLVQLTPTVWVQFHIIISVITYGLLTIGAISGCAVIISNRGGLLEASPKAIKINILTIKNVENSINKLIKNEIFKKSLQKRIYNHFYLTNTYISKKIDSYRDKLI